MKALTYVYLTITRLVGSEFTSWNGRSNALEYWKALGTSQITKGEIAMFTDSNVKTASHLIHLIVSRNEDIPNFSLLLGAGASLTSGVNTAQDMIDDWRRMLFQRSGESEDYQSWLTGQPWNGHDDEYSILFETIYDQPSQRRVFIEECVKKARPSWGYVYLTDLLLKRYFDVVFTTNFDDLLNEACYLYSEGLRPIVAAHDSAIQGIRVTSGRPKIIKLHGDFLYDNIKNTLSELETLESNTKRKLHQFAQEYGLVTLGYSGRDRSVMDTIELLLKDEENYKQGVYWCIKSGDEPSERLKSLLRKDRVYLVEIDGFDEFLAELHTAAELKLPRRIARPFEIAEDRVRLFVRNSLATHPVIGEHIREVLLSINEHRPEIPVSMEAAILSSMGDVIEAVVKWKEAAEDEPKDEDIAFSYAEALADAGKNEDLAKYVLDSPLTPSNQTYMLLRAKKYKEVIEIANAALADPTLIDEWDESNEVIRINRAIAFKRLGQVDDMIADLEILEKDGYSSDSRLKAGIAALRGEKEEMMGALVEALHRTITPEQLRAYPVFDDFRSDPDFQALLRVSEADRNNAQFDTESHYVHPVLIEPDEN